MWTDRFTPKGELRPPPPGVGRMIVTGGTGVLALLGGFYFSMLYSKRQQERTGTNPIYEQVIARVGTKPMSTHEDDLLSLPSRVSQTRSSRQMTPPKQEHEAQHDSLEQRKVRAHGNGGDFDQARRQQPAPQRVKADGSGKLVSQSTSDFMKSYGSGK